MSYTLEKITFMKAFNSHACRARNLLIMVLPVAYPPYSRVCNEIYYTVLGGGEMMRIFTNHVLLIHTILLHFSVLVLTAVVMSKVSMRRTNDVTC